MENLDSLSNDLSFVILGSDSMLSESNGDRCPPSFIPIQNQSFDFHTALDVQEKLDQLLKENADLKNALNQNNLAMKTQFETLAEWQKEVLLTHETHKQKFSETRDLVLKLKSENHLLKNDLGDKQKRMSDSSRQGGSDNPPDPPGDLKKLKVENFILVKERDSFREECTRLTIKISDLESKIRNKSEEMIVLKNKYESLSLIDDFRRSQDIASGELLSSPLESINHSNSLRKENSSLQSWACVQGKSDSKEKALLEENEALKRLLQEEKMSKSNIVADLLQYEEELKKERDSKKNVEIIMQQKVDEVFKLNYQLIEKEKLLLAELQEVKLKNSQLTLEASNNSLFQTQLEAYAADFNDERAAREKLAGEKESLCKEIRALKREREVKNDEPNPESPVLQEEMKCPICQKVFRRYEDCTIHVEICLNNHQHHF